LDCSYVRETLQRDAERKLSDGSKFDAARCKSVTISWPHFTSWAPSFKKS
jgi:hypothetical protein